MRKKFIRLTLIPTERARYILERIGYINSNGKMRGVYGQLNEFISGLIERSFKGQDILEVEFPRQQIAQKNKQIENINKEIAVLATQIQQIRKAKHLNIN